MGSGSFVCLKEHNDCQMLRTFEDEEKRWNKNAFRMPRAFADAGRKKKQQNSKMLRSFKDEEE